MPGQAYATTSVSQHTNAWDSADAVDRKRIEAEQQAVRDLVTNLGGTCWKGIVKQQANRG